VCDLGGRFSERRSCSRALASETRGGEQEENRKRATHDQADDRHCEGIGILSILDAAHGVNSQRGVSADPCSLWNAVQDRMSDRSAVERLDQQRGQRRDSGDPAQCVDDGLQAIPIGARVVGFASGARLATLIVP